VVGAGAAATAAAVVADAAEADATDNRLNHSKFCGNGTRAIVAPASCRRFSVAWQSTYSRARARQAQCCAMNVAHLFRGEAFQHKATNEDRNSSGLKTRATLIRVLS